MTEREMKHIIMKAIKKVVLPTAMGVGLALSAGGCGDQADVADDTINDQNSAKGEGDGIKGSISTEPYSTFVLKVKSDDSDYTYEYTENEECSVQFSVGTTKFSYDSAFDFSKPDDKRTGFSQPRKAFCGTSDAREGLSLADNWNTNELNRAQALEVLKEAKENQKLPFEQRCELLWASISDDVKWTEAEMDAYNTPDFILYGTGGSPGASGGQALVIKKVGTPCAIDTGRFTLMGHFEGIGNSAESDEFNKENNPGRSRECVCIDPVSIVDENTCPAYATPFPEDVK